MPPMVITAKDDTYYLNHCARSLARDNSDARHNYGQFPDGDSRGSIAEAWRFPIIDSYFDRADPESYASNIVTFVFVRRDLDSSPEISVLGTFADLVTPIPLRQVGDSVYWARTVVVPKGQSHRYQFLTGGRALLDPINPQRVQLPDGTVWSRFFTDYCTDTLVLEPWEARLLERLTTHILPFRTREGQRFLDYYYNGLDRQAKDAQLLRAYRFDQPVGAVNFIDKCLAREESHRLVDYKICLSLIDRVLRLRNPYVEPSQMSALAFGDLYEQLANDDGRIMGWDYARYANPRFFLQLLRRHTYTGAFSHPKHGGNSGAAGWAFLAENLAASPFQTLSGAQASASYFDWRRALEPPLGRNTEYLG